MPAKRKRTLSAKGAAAKAAAAKRARAISVSSSEEDTSTTDGDDEEEGRLLPGVKALSTNKNGGGEGAVGYIGDDTAATARRDTGRLSNWRMVIPGP